MPMPSMSPLLTEKQAAALLTCSHRSLQKARVSGVGIAIPFIKIGSLVRYEERDVLDYIARNRRDLLARAAEQIAELEAYQAASAAKGAVVPGAR